MASRSAGRKPSRSDSRTILPDFNTATRSASDRPRSRLWLPPPPAPAPAPPPPPPLAPGVHPHVAQPLPELVIAAVEAVHLPVEAEVLQHCQLAVEVRLVGEQADAAPHLRSLLHHVPALHEGA